MIWVSCRMRYSPEAFVSAAASSRVSHIWMGGRAVLSAKPTAASRMAMTALRKGRCRLGSAALVVTDESEVTEVAC